MASIAEKLKNASPAKKQALREQANDLLDMLEAYDEEADDNQHVWIRNKVGRVDMITKGSYRKYYKKQDGFELLDADEVEEQGRQVQASLKAREKAQKKMLDGMDEAGLRAKIAEMEAKFDAMMG